MASGIAMVRAESAPAPRALAPSVAFWAAMLAASALGTNLGDLWTDQLGLGLFGSAAILATASLALLIADRYWPRGELFFWLAIVVLRAMATNIGDFLTDDVGLARSVSTPLLAVATLAAGAFTSAGRSPGIDLRYWLAMALGGVFGTVGGDLVSHAIGLPAAAVGMVAAVVVTVALRSAFAPALALGYWVIVLAERAAGTAVGDLFAEERGLSLGLPVAVGITGSSLILALAVRARATLKSPAR